MKVFWIIWALVVALLMCIEKFPSRPCEFVLDNKEFKDSLIVGRVLMITKVDSVKNRITCTAFTDDHMATLLWARKDWHKILGVKYDGMMQDEEGYIRPEPPRWTVIACSFVPYKIVERCFDWPTALKVVNSLQTFKVENASN